MNQKIVVAISIIAIVLSLINLATLFLPKSASGNGNLLFSSTAQNLYVANVTYWPLDSPSNLGSYGLHIVNPTNETRIFTFAFALTGLPTPTWGGNTTVEFQSFFNSGGDTHWIIGNAYPIWPNETTQVFVDRPLLFTPKVRISLLDEFEGIVFSEALDVIKQS